MISPFPFDLPAPFRTLSLSLAATAAGHVTCPDVAPPPPTAAAANVPAFDALVVVVYWAQWGRCPAAAWDASAEPLGR